MIIICLKKENGEIVHQLHFELFTNTETKTKVVPAEFLRGLAGMYPEYDIFIFQLTGFQNILCLIAEDTIWTDALDQINEAA